VHPSKCRRDSLAPRAYRSDWHRAHIATTEAAAARHVCAGLPPVEGGGGGGLRVALRGTLANPSPISPRSASAIAMPPPPLLRVPHAHHTGSRRPGRNLLIIVALHPGLFAALSSNLARTQIQISAGPSTRQVVNRIPRRTRSPSPPRLAPRACAMASRRPQRTAARIVRLRGVQSPCAPSADSPPRCAPVASPIGRQASQKRALGHGIYAGGHERFPLVRRPARHRARREKLQPRFRDLLQARQAPQIDHVSPGEASRNFISGTSSCRRQNLARSESIIQHRRDLIERRPAGA